MTTSASFNESSAIESSVLVSNLLPEHMPGELAEQSAGKLASLS